MKTSNIKYAFRRFKQGCKNLIRWFPVIWKDRDFDFAFLEELILQKLDHMILFFGSHDVYVGQERDLDRMVTAKILLTAVREETYLDLSEWLTQESYIDDRGYLQFKTIEDNLGEYYDLYPRIYTEVVLDLANRNIEITRERIAIHMSHKNHNRARQLAYKIIAHYSPGWWI